MATEGVPPQFRFLPRRSGKLDWRALSTVDLERIQRETDIDTLEQHLHGVVFANVTAEGSRAAAQPFEPS